MNKLLRPFSFRSLRNLLPFFVLLFAFAETASAQVMLPNSWTPVAQKFYNQIHIVKFLDAVGAPTSGFVGDDTGIWYTTNTGTSWTRATIVSPNHNLPSTFPTGYVNDITFEQGGMKGFAVVDSVVWPGANVPDAGILITTNGGSTWTWDDNTGTPDSGRGIYYDNNTSRLYVSTIDRGLVVSDDEGKTWSVIDTGKNYTGFAFNGNGFGLVATEGTVCNDGQHTYYWLLTTDDGLTWAKGRMFTETWQPLGIPTTETFFTSTGNNCLGQTESILRSDNAGYSFGPLSNYKGTGDTLTQDMAGDGCSIFATSHNGLLGLWFSTNEGASWANIPSSPAPGVNTRFYVSPSTVWSFTSDSVYKLKRPATPDIHVWPLTVEFTNAACMTTSDTQIHIFGCNCANSPTLTGATVQRLTNIVDTIAAVPSAPSPAPLCVSGISTPISVDLQFQPTSDLSDTASITLSFLDSGKTVDTVISMGGAGVAANPQFDVSGTITMQGPACAPEIDTCLVLTNSSCNTIILDNCNTSEDSKCACQLQLIGCCDLANGPITLSPGDSWNFCIAYVPGLKVSSCDASFSINWHTSDGSKTGTTNSVFVVGETSTEVKPSFRGFNITAASCCTVPADTTIFFVNTTCDTITLESPIFRGNNASAKNFTLDSNTHPPLHFPITLPPGQHVPLTIDINCQAGTSKAFITFPYTIAGTFSSNNSCAIGSDCAAFASDTLLDTISLTSGALATVAGMTPNLVNFGFVNCCDSTEEKTVTISAGCKADTITAITLSNSPGSNFFIDISTIQLPYILLANRQVSFLVGFLPRCGSGSGGTDTGSVVATLMEAGQLTSGLRAVSTNLATASETSTTLNFGSVQQCSPQTCLIDTFSNASCGTIQISVKSPPQHSCFTMTGPSSASMVVGGPVNPDTICFDPSACGVTGAISDMVILQVCDPTGNNCTFDTVFLTANIIPPVPGYTVTPIPSATICDSAMVGETFSLTNTGTCYVYNIKSVSTGNSQVTVTPQTATIDSGRSQTFNVTYMPTSVGTISGWVVLTNSDGTTDSVQYSFTDTSCAPTGGVFSITLDPSNATIVTTPCNLGQMTFDISDGGVTGSVNSVSVTGSGRFTPKTPTSGAIPFTGGVIFDPNQSGGNSALVTINYSINGTSAQDTFTVYGQINGSVDTVHIGVTSPTNTCILPNDTDQKEFDVILHDPIPDSMNITTLTFVISYDGNLLFNPQQLGNLPAGWTATLTDKPDGIHVTMTYSGTSGLPANTTLLKLTQLGAVSDSNTSTAKITNPLFNDSMYAACSLTALSASGDSANICIDNSGCGALPLQRDLLGTLQTVSGIQVVPNPAHKGSSEATLHFTTNVSANVTADILDMLGHSVETLVDGPFETGDHVLAIPTDQMTEGAYFARITVNGVTVIRQFVLSKE